MKLLHNSEGAYLGAFKDVEVLQDRLVCDGVLYYLASIGSNYELTDGDPAPITYPQDVPQTVTMRQARLALLGAGKLAAVAAAIASLPSPQREAAQIEWDYSSVVERHRQLVATLAPAMGLDDAGVDALFIAADKL